MVPCATIYDSVPLTPVGDITPMAAEFNGTRLELKKLSDTETLINEIQKGEVIMMKKVKFDTYLKAQVDLVTIYLIFR